MQSELEGPKFGYVPEHEKIQTVIHPDFLVVMLVNLVHALSEAAELQPQASFVVFTKSLQTKWTFVHRVLPNIDDVF